MSKETLVHIVPAVPPAFNGLADYCYKLWEHWPQPRPEWKCLSAEVSPSAHEAWPQAQIVPFERSKSGLLAGLERTAPDCVVLHYVGYAYQKKGMPLWLPAALREWKTRSGKRVCVMFHELYAFGTPRQSAFWLQPWTKSIIVQLAQLADVWVTSNENAAARLVHSIGVDARRGRLIPIGAGIEPAMPIDFERPWPLDVGAKLRIAVFGMPATRINALNAHWRLLKTLVERDLVGSISLIGKSENAPSEALHACKAQIAPANAEVWLQYPDLAPAQLSDVLREHHLALSSIHPQLMTRSSSYAAACVHGLPTICAPHAPNSLPSSGLDGGSHGQVPLLTNDDDNPSATLDILCDAVAMRNLRARVKHAALHDLNWPSLMSQWSEVIEPHGAQRNS